jgi:hypothetical protein
VIAIQPAQYTITRSAKMNAAPEAVFDQINNFHNWEAWSPWAKRDPAAKNTFEGPDAGTGAVFSWAGNAEVGEGRMTITESRPHEQIRIRLDFIKPFASTANTEFSFTPEDNQTAVTWTMSGNNNFIGKAICMFMNMDKMIGGDFEAGLAGIRSVVETPQ